MGFFYCDTDGSGASAPYGSWATAAQDLVTVTAAMSAGDICFFQGAATDTAASARSLTGGGTPAKPSFIIGAVDGTTNTGTSVVVSDLAATLPIFQVTGATNDITFSNSLVIINVELDISDNWTFGADVFLKLINSTLKVTDRWNPSARIKIVFENVIFDVINAAGNLRPVACDWEWNGGSLVATATSSHLVDNASDGKIDFHGVDLSAGFTAVAHTSQNTSTVTLRNCQMPSSYALYSGAPASKAGFVELIGSSNATSVGNTSSIQDYEYESIAGTVDDETTIVRTGGATDGASGLFSYAMLPRVNSTNESGATLISPWMSVWVSGGASKTLKVFTTHDNADSGNADLNQDDLWCEFYTPDNGDTAQHDQTIVCTNSATLGANDDERLLESATATGTDDTASTWATHNTYKRSFDLTLTPGFEGWAYARVHFAKAYASSPVTVYVDPLIEVT